MRRGGEPRRPALGLLLLPGLILDTAYVLLEPPSRDLAAQLLRARLFSSTGFGLWNNWWYGGHHTPGYSVLFGPLAAWLEPRLVAALAAALAGILLARLALDEGPTRRLGRRELAAAWLCAAPALELYSGRLSFALGLLPAAATAHALIARHPGRAALCGALTALCSPVAALFAALAGACTLVDRSRRSAASAALAGSLIPALLLALAFPEGGTEPFALSALWPILLLAPLAVLLRAPRPIQAGALLLAGGCLIAYLVPSPVGGNAVRLGPLLAGPLALLYGARARRWALVPVLLALLYLQWQVPVRDVADAAGDPATDAAYYDPLLAYLHSRAGGPFRVEIPLTANHWEAFELAPSFALARGWERQLDRRYDGLFYGRGELSARTYERWLDALAVAYVALPDVALDPSARAERRLLAGGLPFLRRAFRGRHWTVYALRRPVPLADPPARVLRLGADSVSLSTSRRATVLLRVRYSPYWAITSGAGCVAPDGGFTRLALPRRERVVISMAFALGRVGASSRRCRD